MMRRVHRREDYIPKGARAFRDRQSSAVVYAYPINTTNRLGLIGFHGRAQKPDFRYAFPDAAGRERYARDFLKRWREWEAARKPKVRQLEVGDILRSSWGYDQTNIDFYEVTALIGERMVEIREINSGATYENKNMAGHCVPLPGDYAGPPMRKFADGESVKVRSFAWAYKVDPILRGGVKTYDPSRYTAYA